MLRLKPHRATKSNLTHESNKALECQYTKLLQGEEYKIFFFFLNVMNNVYIVQACLNLFLCFIQFIPFYDKRQK